MRTAITFAAWGYVTHLAGEAPTNLVLTIIIGSSLVVAILEDIKQI
jgi:hypothetical protein